MWNINRVVGKNFFSYTDIDYSFLQNKCVMIYGLNETDPGSNSNGAGKSTIIELITLLLTNETCREIDKEDFINDESESMNGELFLDNKVLKKTLSIKRTFLRGSKPSVVLLTENGKENKKITSVGEANKRIIELIGISREDLLNYFIIGQGTNHSFFTAGDAEKKEIINRLTNASIMESVLDEIDTKKASTESKRNELLSKKEVLETKIETVEENIEYEKANHEKNIKDKIKALQLNNHDNSIKLKEADNKLAELSKKKEIKNKLLTDAEAKVAKQQKKDFKKIQDELDSEMKAAEKDLKDANRLAGEIETALAGKVKCPKCNSEFLPKSEMTLKQAQEGKKDVEALIIDLKKSIEEITEKDFEIEKEKDKLQDDVRVVKEVKSELSIINVDRVHYIGKKATIQNLIEENKEKIKSLEIELKKPSRLSELKTKLAEHNKSLEEIAEQIVSHEKDVEMVLFWKHHLSKKGFLTFLANKAVKSIEGVTNLYLKKFNTNLSVLINGYTKLKNGDLRDKIEIFVQRNGISKGRFGRFSGGERARIDIAGIVGLQKLINISCNGGGLNFLAIDETFESVDRHGQSEILSILQSTGVTTLVISHVSDSLGAENELFVVKRNGVSFLKT
jgi:exonuclease SbcC